MSRTIKKDIREILRPNNPIAMAKSGGPGEWIHASEKSMFALKISRASITHFSRFTLNPRSPFPFIVLGRAPFNFLPPTMIRAVKDPGDLGFEIRDLLERYQVDEKALLCYIAAVMKESVPVDFYSRLLGRRGVYAPSGAKEDPSRGEEAEERVRQIESLAGYLLRRLEGTKES